MRRSFKFGNFFVEVPSVLRCKKELGSRGWRGFGSPPSRLGPRRASPFILMFPDLITWPRVVLDHYADVLRPGCWEGSSPSHSHYLLFVMACQVSTKIIIYKRREVGSRSPLIRALCEGTVHTANRLCRDYGSHYTCLITCTHAHSHCIGRIYRQIR